MLKGFDLLCFGDDYDRMPSTFQRIVKEISRENRVLWVNSLGERRIEFSLRDLRRIIEKIRSVGMKETDKIDKVVVFSPLAFPMSYDWRVIRRLNAKLVLFQLRRIMKKVGMKSPIVMSAVRGVFDLIEVLPKRLVVYFCLDDYRQLYKDRNGFLEEAEEKLMKTSAVVFVTSRSLITLKKGSNRFIKYIGQGVDYGNFSRAQESIEVAHDIKSIKKPIIGFCGTLDHWVDFELINKIAISRPGWAIVLIGRKDTDLEMLKRAENIYYLGRKDFGSLPAYIKAFDCAIIPFKIDELTKYVNPLKALEYLASGKPVVSTYMPDLEQTQGLVYLTRTPDQFIACIEKAMNEDSKERVEKRLKYSQNYTWPKRAEEVSNIIGEFLK